MTREKAINDLNKKHDIRFNYETEVIQILSNDSKNKINDIGIKSLGKIDFLCKYEGFRKVYVLKF